MHAKIKLCTRIFGAWCLPGGPWLGLGKIAESFLKKLNLNKMENIEISLQAQIAKMLKERRKALGLTLDQMAAKETMPIQAPNLHRIESGQQNITLQMLETIAPGYQIIPTFKFRKVRQVKTKKQHA